MILLVPMNSLWIPWNLMKSRWVHCVLMAKLAAGANLFVTALREKMSSDHPVRRLMSPFTSLGFAMNFSRFFSRLKMECFLEFYDWNILKIKIDWLKMGCENPGFFDENNIENRTIIINVLLVKNGSLGRWLVYHLSLITIRYLLLKG